MEIDVTPDAQAAVDVAKSLIDRQPHVSLDCLKGLMQSPYREVQAVAALVVVNHPERIDWRADSWRDAFSFVLPFLLTSLLENKSNEYRLSRYESAYILEELFGKLWKMGNDAEGELRAVRDALAHVCSTSDRDVVNALLTGILEHLFCDDCIVEYFNSWKNDSLLAAVFREGKYLADGFKSLDKKKA